MSTPSGSALPNPSATIGALEIGTLFTTFLFGIATIQAYHYYRRYPNDPTWLKAMVGVVWLCVVGHTTTVTYGMYQVSVTEFGELSGEILDPLPAGFAWSIMISGLLAPLVQAFFAHRIYLFSQKLYLSLICWTLSFLRFLGSMVGTAFASKRTSLQAFGEKYGWLITGLLVMGAVNDTIIAGGLCYCLRYERVFRMGRTAKPVDQFVAYTLETGVLTGITALTIFICFKAMPQNLAWFSLFLFFGELFANSLLAS
ncbi:hypothetical protein BV22DRAFT_675624 [Leucogyrophana mollusca]|uniref:Uncharacterized protein n=1 Tax=Leucogyrophana mollusca TaxID=85980 RepID=A0ACB8BAE7_9AGAM|nr:hypothetical protein BV22DRAFT_675624 [Leucogyrophana mollusca]